MTDIIETHGPSGVTIQAVGKRPWNAPRLIDLDDIETERAGMRRVSFRLSRTIPIALVGEMAMRPGRGRKDCDEGWGAGIAGRSGRDRAGRPPSLPCVRRAWTAA